MHRPHSYHRLGNNEPNDHDNDDDLPLPNTETSVQRPTTLNRNNSNRSNSTTSANVSTSNNAKNDTMLPPFNLTRGTFAFDPVTNSDSHQNNAPAEHPPAPLMPLFTPVLKDFQNRFGSSILQQHTPDNDNDNDDPLDYRYRSYGQHGSDHDNLSYGRGQSFDDDDHGEGEANDSEYSHQQALLRNAEGRRRGENSYTLSKSQEIDDGSGLSSTSTSMSTSGARHHHHQGMFGGGGVGVSDSSHHQHHSYRQENNNRRGQQQQHTSPLFTTATNHSRSPGSSPFFVGSNTFHNNERMSHKASSSRDHHFESNNTDHEAPASLMIEMNQGGQDDDDDDNSRGRYWNLGQKARRRLQYKRPGMDAAELAMWKWVNVENLDNFLAKVYEYYVGKGMYTILLERCLNLLTFAFVIGFSTFLVGCIDYPRLRHAKHMDEVLIPQCFHKLSSGTVIILLLFGAFWVGQLTRLIYDVPELSDMCNFYTYLLQIPDEDIQTVSWHEVVNRIIRIRDNNPNTTTAATIQTTSTQRLNAHDIANRIMRKENFMIAMFNKELLDLSIPLPMLRHRTILTRILEWSLSFCILGYVFDDRGQVRKRFLKDTRRAELVTGLKRRFQFMGLTTLLFAPLISIYLVLYFFFRYFEEYHKNPSSIGTRQYTPVAKWKFKEFNELPHLFQERINASYPLAMKYINQFPKEKTILVCRFVAFISGSFAAVLALITIFDQELLLGLEITTEKTVFFYLGVFGTIMAVSRGMIPDQTEVFDPELLLRDVVEYTHYMPNEWRDKLHTDEVRKQFALLFEYNVMLYALEFMSLALTPLILCMSLPNCSEKIIDFFREFTVHVDGVGYVCSFAVFDFKRHGNVKYGAPAATVTDDRYISNEGKMEKSFLNFKQNNPDWEPNDPAGSMYLSKLMEADAGMHMSQFHPPSSRGPYGRHPQRSRVDYLRQGQWGQSSAYMRPTSKTTHLRHAAGTTGGGGGGLAGSLYYQRDMNRYQGMEMSRLGRYGDYGQDENSYDVDDDHEHGVESRAGAGAGAGISFRLRNTKLSRQAHHLGQDVNSESSDMEDEGRGGEGGRGRATSTLGDSFVSEIGNDTRAGSKGTGATTLTGKDRAYSGHHDSKGKGRQGEDGPPDEMVDSFENEQDVRKKGVFGLLNQIYEMHNADL